MTGSAPGPSGLSSSLGLTAMCFLYSRCPPQHLPYHDIVIFVTTLSHLILHLSVFLVLEPLTQVHTRLAMTLRRATNHGGDPQATSPSPWML
jgi:hypothetical protein